MKKVKEKTWYEIEPIVVATPDGTKVVTSLYCNGFEPTLHLFFKNNENTLYDIECTFDHAFRLVSGEWVCAEDIEPHHELDNGYKLLYYKVCENPSMTFDISVPSENCYILESGIVSHNTALLMGGISEGINPDPAMTYNQLTAAGEVLRINPVLLQLMKDKGCYSEKNTQKIIAANGSVQGHEIDFLTEKEKTVFKTAFEINQKDIIRLASARARFIDQWQSLNLFFASDESPVWIAEVHKQAFLDENILGLYYIYTQSGVKGSKGGCEACQ